MDEELVIESRIMPGDVVHVRNDQPALIRLTSANQRLVPFIDGRVVYVSADAVAEADPRRVPVGSHGSFVVRVQITDPELKTKARDFQPMPGMPVELFIKTGERTFFQYIVKPITDSFTRAFREQ
jgi:HlyD family secretion protein